MATRSGFAPGAHSPLVPLRAHWRAMREAEASKDRWTSFGVLAFGTLSAATAALLKYIF